MTSPTLAELTTMGDPAERNRVLGELLEKLGRITDESKDGLAVFRYDDASITPAMANLKGWWRKGNTRYRWTKLSLYSLNRCLAIDWQPHKPYSALERLAKEAE